MPYNVLYPPQGSLLCHVDHVILSKSRTDSFLPDSKCRCCEVTFEGLSVKLSENKTEYLQENKKVQLYSFLS